MEASNRQNNARPLIERLAELDIEVSDHCVYFWTPEREIAYFGLGYGSRPGVVDPDAWIKEWRYFSIYTDEQEYLIVVTIWNDPSKKPNVYRVYRSAV
jgi:hypothetical protein